MSCRIKINRNRLYIQNICLFSISFFFQMFNNFIWLCQEIANRITTSVGRTFTHKFESKLNKTVIVTHAVNKYNSYSKFMNKNRIYFYIDGSFFLFFSYCNKNTH